MPRRVEPAGSVWNQGTGVGSTLTANGGATLNAGTSYLAGNVTSVATAISVTGSLQVANLAADPVTNPITVDSGGAAISITGGTVSGYSGTVADYAAFSLNKAKSATGSGVGLSAITVAGTSYVLQLFTSSGTDSFYTPYGISSLEYLLVGGGGGSGGGSGSGSGGLAGSGWMTGAGASTTCRLGTSMRRSCQGKARPGIPNSSPNKVRLRSRAWKNVDSSRAKASRRCWRRVRRSAC